MADKIILTSEDPRYENPAVIANQILSGIPPEQKRRVTIELDRAKAINLAINRLARPGDWVVSCGKGHEESLNLDGETEIPWSEHQVMQKALEEKP